MYNEAGRNKGHVDISRLRRALEDINYNCDDALLMRLMREFDGDRSGTITETEWRECCDFLLGLEKTFKRYQNEDRLSLAAVNAMVTSTAEYSGVQPATLGGIFRRFSTPLPGRDPNTTYLNRPSFLSLALYLRAATRSFDKAQPDGAGRVQLNFDKFVGALLNFN